ncbi:hypothetical protein QC764_308555 [Podospora pseudoanserina]|uniref:Uncharacterized protein n=1 Tax=Podospora pseudoanserina TaxID=2609844 RepID=A0ABR0IDT2_9PEZI|nr:hypothetical protein QC764_308555 [Podospora pseudoanserina]
MRGRCGLRFITQRTHGAGIRLGQLTPGLSGWYSELVPSEVGVYRRYVARGKLATAIQLAAFLSSRSNIDFIPYVEPSQHFQKQSIQPLPEPYNIAPDNIPSFISHHQPSSLPSKPRPFKQTNSTSPSLQSSQKFQGRQCKRSDQTAISICLNSPHLQYHPINPNKSPDPGISKAVTYSISYTTTVILLP